MTMVDAAVAEVFLTQPLQIVAGSVAGSKWMSDGLYKRAASKDKKFHIVEGANHMSLYDVLKYVDEAVSVSATFFKSNLDLKESIVEEVLSPKNVDSGYNESCGWRIDSEAVKRLNSRNALR